MLGDAELVPEVAPKLPNKDFEGAEVEVDVGGAADVEALVVPCERLANILGAAEVEGVEVPPNNGAVAAGDITLVEACVPGALLAAVGKLNTGLGASEAGAVVEEAFAPELTGVEEGLLKRLLLEVEFVVPSFKFAKRELGFGWVDSVGFAVPKRGCCPLGADPNKDFAWPFSAGGGPAGVVEFAIEKLGGAGVVEPAGVAVEVLGVKDPNKLLPDVLFRPENRPPGVAGLF